MLHILGGSTRPMQFRPRHFLSARADLGGVVEDEVAVASSDKVDCTGAAGGLGGGGGTREHILADCSAGRAGEAASDEKITGVPARLVWDPNSVAGVLERPRSSSQPRK